MNNYKNYVVPTIAGWYSHNFLSKYMLISNKGVQYYGEAHLSKWNAWIHTIGMPVSIYGLLLCIPALFKLNPNKAKKIMWILYYFYGGHYLRMNVKNSLLYYVMFFPSVYMANKNYEKHTASKENVLSEGLLISSAALTFQEIVGHWIGNDIQSRFEAIPNAILYAMYFAATHMVP